MTYASLPSYQNSLGAEIELCPLLAPPPTCSSSDEIIQRWQGTEFAELNLPPATHCQQLSDLAANAPDDQFVSIDQPLLHEVRAPIDKLTNGRG